ncbi:hypothetical protein ACQEVS_19670 [Streptomyces sp. CA-181903]|uniref:hypothetical protein n=1 Tax=Streptomyces sp. CA-181903 TaxID=3240055 RepID=UPI003D91E438
MILGPNYALENRLARVERKLDLILEHLGIQDADAPYLAEVRALVREGKTIQAIKVHREATGASLKEAKDVVDAIKEGRR